MKVAFCLHGIVGGALGKGGEGPGDKILRLGHEYNQNRIFRHNTDVDVFIHTWSVDMQDQIRKYYKPVAMHAQEQLYFDTSKLLKVDKREPNRINNHYSKWYSTQQVLKLRQDYERKTGTKYDCVMLSRFDIAWQKDILFDNHNMKFLYFPHLCMYKHNKTKKRIGHPVKYWENRESINLADYSHYHVGWPHRVGSWGFWDCWFFSKPSIMDQFGQMFDNLDTYVAENKQLRRGISHHSLIEIHLAKIELLKRVRFFMHFMTDCPVIRGWHAKDLMCPKI